MTTVLRRASQSVILKESKSMARELKGCVFTGRFAWLLSKSISLTDFYVGCEDKEVEIVKKSADTHM